MLWAWLTLAQGMLEDGGCSAYAGYEDMLMGDVAVGGVVVMGLGTKTEAVVRGGSRCVGQLD